MKIQGDELYGALVIAGVDPEKINIADGNYMAPTEAWLVDEFGPWFRKAMDGLCDGTEYNAEDWDCDDYADLYSCLCKCLNRKGKKAAGCGITVGTFWYFPDTGGGHAIICAMVEGKKLVWIEPQNGTVVKLSQKEIESCAACTF